MKKYLIVFAIISAGLVAAYYLLNDLLFYGYLHDFFPLLVAFFFLQSLVVSWLLKKGSKDKSKFAMYGLGSIVFRLISSVILLIILFLVRIPDATPLAIQFMAVYLVFLAFELIMVISNLRRISG